MSLDSPKKSIDDIVTLVKQKALKLESKQATKPIDQADSALLVEASSALPDWIMGKSAYHLGELLIFADDTVLYIRVLYQVLLNRPVDEDGLNYYSSRLNNGTISPIIFFLMIYLSSEGRSVGTVVKMGRGLGRLFQLHTGLPTSKLRRIPYLAPVAVRSIDYIINGYARYFKRRYILQDGFSSLHKAIQHDNQQLYIQKQAMYSIKAELLTLVEQQNTKIIAQNAKIIVQNAEIEAQNAEIEAQNTKINLIRHDDCYQQNYIRRMIALLENPQDSVLTKNNNSQRLVQQFNTTMLDAYYVAFEDANRGTLAEITTKLSVYLPLLERYKADSQHYPMLDVGCGRGEWLKLLQEQGYTVKGVDMNPAMLDIARQQDLDVYTADAIAYLSQQADHSLSVISAFHIIEHLPFKALFTLFAEAYRCLKQGGCIIFETPNPENILVGSHTFYHDFTHRNPITPTSVDFLAQYHNFIDIEIKRLHPYPKEAKVVGNDDLTNRVNGHLCSAQDFAIIAYKPTVDQIVAQQESG